MSVFLVNPSIKYELLSVTVIERFSLPNSFAESGIGVV